MKWPAKGHRGCWGHVPWETPSLQICNTVTIIYIRMWFVPTRTQVQAQFLKTTMLGEGGRGPWKVLWPPGQSPHEYANATLWEQVKSHSLQTGLVITRAVIEWGYLLPPPSACDFSSAGTPLPLTFCCEDLTGSKEDAYQMLWDAGDFYNWEVSKHLFFVNYLVLNILFLLQQIKTTSHSL